MEYRRTSPSQRSTFDLCQRRWSYGSIKKLPQPQNKYAASGDAMHKQLEAYSLEGVTPTHPSCLEAVQYIAPPKTEGILIEGWTNGLMIGDFTINGRIDYFDGRDPLRPYILDWKSKSNPKGIPSKKKLSTDTQLSIYGKWALSMQAPDATGVTVAHGYLGRAEDGNDPFVKIVPVELTRETILETTEAMIPGFLEMRVAATKEPEDLPRNESACFAFGERCPFYAACFPTASDKFANMFPDEGTTDMSIIATLKASPGAASIPDPKDFVGVTTATPVPTTEATDSTVAEGTGGALLEKLRGM